MSLEKFLAKAAADVGLLGPEARAIAEGRIKALQSVRKAIADDGELIHKGASAKTFDAGNGMVVKTQRDMGSTPLKGILDQEFRRRGYMKDILAEMGMAPETHLVETQNKKYLVQPKMAEAFHNSIDDEPEFVKLFEDSYNKGVQPSDLHSENLMRDDKGKLNFIDSGNFKYPRENAPWGEAPVQTEADRQRARQKFVSYGKRAKPWLED